MAREGAETSPPDLTDYFGPCLGNEVSVIRLKRFLQSPLELPMRCPQHVPFRVMLTRRRIGLVQAREPLEEDERFDDVSREGSRACRCVTMSYMKTSTLTIRLDDALGRELDEACARTGRSRSDLARDALRRQLALLRFERLRKRTLPLAEAQGYLTDEDVFRDVS